MKRLTWAAVAGLVLAVAGCSQESSPGGPGVATTTTSSTNNTVSNAPKSTTHTANRPTMESGTGTAVKVTNRNETFTLKVPEMTTSVKPGDDKGKDVTVSISRGRDFNQNVKVQFKAPVGVSISPATATIPAGQDKVTVKVQAAKNAHAGKMNVDVTAVPESGRSVSLELPIEVKGS